MENRARFLALRARRAAPPGLVQLLYPEQRIGPAGKGTPGSYSDSHAP
jgi:hypothetical protein